ncbi:TPA: sulfite exporter TauE/SafE family protein [Candidatus Woesearchaeota archaeon]|nr:MAG: hypothetical protein QT04_C0031G0005 [archaeon GW2011_AR11]MBS3111129.1 sulfite exporter TauE/SafE family protein [Candidatus Woesearchaeota archaeon]HIH05438.1 sulfite exporter TauE/SafE family protein [Candidatus Woesearchaeota archaeon]HII64096.1 sulfite exporter TauE/SafE family protein [Candidatus Woesearchaeota archaeon]HII66210.1 sulfite exporter TauE/SafE family protein [Candidatus Woesearchaeota archaeon]
MDIIWLILAVFFSEIIGTLTGFGSSTMLLPLALLLIDFHSALVIVAIVHIAGNISRFLLFRKDLNIRLLKQFGLPSVIFGVLGAYLVTLVPLPLVQASLGAVLLLYVFVSWHMPRFKLRMTPRNCVIGGASSGFMAGMLGTGGALKGAFLHAFRLKTGEYMATIAAIALIVDMTRLPVYFAGDFLSPALYSTIPALIAVALVSALLGRSVIRHISQHAFRQGVLIAVGLISLKFLWDGIHSLL